MKIIYLALNAILISFACTADSTITSLKVMNDVAYFTTSEIKIAQSPACVLAENIDKWAISLNTATGKATYSLLVTATAANKNISVTTANDCSDASGFERPLSVEITSGGDKGSQPLYLYQSDGLTEVGPIIDIVDNSTFRYFSKDDEYQLLTYSPAPSVNGIYYEKANCQGTLLALTSGTSQIRVALSANFNEGNYFYISRTAWAGTYASVYSASGCENLKTPKTKSWVYVVSTLNYIHPVCGEKHCRIKPRI